MSYVLLKRSCVLRDWLEHSRPLLLLLPLLLLALFCCRLARSCQQSCLFLPCLSFVAFAVLIACASLLSHSFGFHDVFAFKCCLRSCVLSAFACSWCISCCTDALVLDIIGGSGSGSGIQRSL